MMSSDTECWRWLQSTSFGKMSGSLLDEAALDLAKRLENVLLLQMTVPGAVHLLW